MDTKTIFMIVSSFAIGFGILLVQYIRKHTGIHTKGTITNVGHPNGKTTPVEVAYQWDNKKIIGIHIMQNLDAAIFRKKIGKEMKIKINPENPGEVQVLSTKFYYIMGWFFILIALSALLGNIYIW